MAPREDTPPLILKATPRGLVPAAAIDAETLAGIRYGTDLQAKVLRVEPSKALRAWWALMNAVVKMDPQQFPSARALSNHILLKHGLVDEEQLVGGWRQVPMSLTTFTDQELWRLVDAAKLVVEFELLPGTNADELLKWAKAE
jgi:hypothetical protein